MQTIPEDVLDVTQIAPAYKHATIFEKFDALEEGASFLFQNDHDPKPLYYQLLGEKGAVFSWEYVQNGPEWWKIRITRHAIPLGDESLGQLVARDVRKAAVFKKYGLDFCCGGKKTVKQACQQKGIDARQVLKELVEIENTDGGRPLPYNDWRAAFLADYIVNTHHLYVRQTAPDILAYADKVARVHGKHHPELVEINQLVKEMMEEMKAHMMKEEEILFPYIKQLDNGLPADAGFASVQSPINVMEMEHETVGEIMAKIRELTSDYTLPLDACGTYSVLFRLLAGFEDDLHLHVHLENNILFPKALKLEREIVSKEPVN